MRQGINALLCSSVEYVWRTALEEVPSMATIAVKAGQAGSVRLSPIHSPRGEGQRFYKQLFVHSAENGRERARSQGSGDAFGCWHSR
jgi:hypothetical protein